MLEFWIFSSRYTGSTLRLYAFYTFYIFSEPGIPRMRSLSEWKILNI